jgi:hypothetical protein
MINAGKKLTGFAMLAIIAASMITCTKISDSTYVPPLTREDSLILKLLYTLNSDSILSTAVWLQDMGTRFALADNRKVVAEGIRDRFLMLGYAGASLDSFQAVTTYKGQEYTTWQYNVTAEITGSVYPDSVNIMGAHYDDIVSTGDPFTVAPGADDNASGVASILEIARVMKVNNYKPSISVKFVAFAAGEFGLLGSADFAAKLKESGRPVRIVINSDMIAAESFPDKLLWAVKVVFHKNSEALSKDVNVTSGKYVGLYANSDSTGNNGLDSYPFYRENYKAISFKSNTDDPNNQTPDDIVSNYNFTYCMLVTGVSCSFLVHND